MCHITIIMRGRTRSYRLVTVTPDGVNIHHHHDGIRKVLKAAFKGFAGDSNYDGCWQAVIFYLYPATWSCWTSARISVMSLTHVLKARYRQTLIMNIAVTFQDAIHA